MNEVTIFNNPDFGEIRTVIIDNEPYFVGNDCAKALGYKNLYNGVSKNVDEEDRRLFPVGSTSGTQETTIINESGLYSLIFGSKLESAKKFKKWVTSEVLPSIRRNGAYQLPQTVDGKIQLLAQGHQELRHDVNILKREVEDIKSNLPILPLEADDIVKAVKKKGIDVLGGKKSHAYNDKRIRQRLYNDLYSNLKHNFDVRTYKAIRRKDVEKALQIIKEYKPPFFLAEQIADANAQNTLDFEGSVA